MAEDHTDFVFGFINVSKISEKPGLVHMTPGVQILSGGMFYCGLALAFLCIL